MAIQTRDAGELRTVLNVHVDPNGRIHAASRADAIDDVVGSWRGWLARHFSGNFPDGALVSLEASAAAARDDDIPLGGFLQTPIGRLGFTGTLRDGQIGGQLQSRRGEYGNLVPAMFDLVRPIDDYPSIVRAAKATVESRLYSPRTQSRSDWREFWTTIERRAARAQDDLEMVFGFFDAASTLKLSHFALTRGPLERMAVDANRESAIKLSEAAPGIALLSCSHFNGVASEIDRAFDAIPQRTTSLIIDLRGCPGGDLSAMRVAAHVLARPAEAGIFLGAKWWVDHDRLPTVEEQHALPLLDREDTQVFFDMLREHGALRGRVQPTPTPFSGSVYVLIDSGTASAAEPLAALLQSEHRATLIGERTAGAMLSSESIDLGNGWSLRLPTADYFTAEGVRLEGRGVTPDRKVPSDRSLEAAIALAR